MRTPILAAAAAAAAASFVPAHAQSSVTLFGVIDATITRQSTDNRHRVVLQGDGNTSSRLGFRGVEDLGGGLSANFWLEAGFNPDTGLGAASNSNNQTSGIAAAPAGTQSLTFGRRSTVGLAGSFGEIRFGRDYVPSFGNLTTSFHPFGTNGVGSSLVLYNPVAAGGTTARTGVRASNAVNYILPGNLGGFYGNAMVAMGENSSNAGAIRDDGDYRGVRVGWRGAGWNMSASTGTTDYATGDYRQSNAGISYQWGAVQLMYLWGRNDVGVTRTTAQTIGTQWRVGPGELRAMYGRLKARGAANDATHIAFGYVYDLSKRTSLYATYATVDNKGTGTAFDVGLAVTNAGGKSTGYELGIKHSF